MPGISIDCVIFGFHDNQLKVLLLKIAGINEYGLPAGFIYKDEHIDTSAKRILNERTGLHDIFLQQFYIFGDPHRCDDNITKNVFENTNINAPKSNWLLQRFLTIGYYALVDFAAMKLRQRRSPFERGSPSACEGYSPSDENGGCAVECVGRLVRNRNLLSDQPERTKVDRLPIRSRTW